MSTKRLHDRPRKLRLTEEADALLVAVARMRDVPPAVVARELLMVGLNTFAVRHDVTVAQQGKNGRAA